jgi:valyl-tRNA synthetase
MSERPEISLPAGFVPADIEARLYQKWLDAGYFKADALSKKEPFTIVIPPPNVTGSLHIGHALDHTLQDLLIRMKRMKGFESLWLPGMDHAGIATQNAVEKSLATVGTVRQDLGREAFVERVWQWKEESGGAILDQMKRLGDSVDWSRERFTMDENLSEAVLEMFKRMYDAGLIYRAERVINWCPRCLTALSDIEVEHSDDVGEMVSIRYGDGENSIVVATTRAETMLGDTAIAVHPDDDRYRHLVGTMISVPLVNRQVRVVADTHVDPEFGTGAVKVTPAHDPNDFEIGMRHGLQNLLIFDAEAKVINTGTAFDGMDRFVARAAVVAALDEQGRVVSQIRPYLHAVGHCQRCDTVVEPRLSKQWFVKVETLAKAAGDAVRDGRVKIEPEELSPRYFDWIDNMHDWCISRQLWWGHRIPVYYGPAGEIVVCGPNEAPPAGYVQDEDVLDTWFSSGLWPMSTLGWPANTPDFQKFYPTSVLVTGYDIIFFWVARMMMFGLFAMDGLPPFKTIVLHGLVRDRFGKKMSKSKGNGIDPIEFMDKYGSDALRFTLARGANPGSDQALAEEWVGGARNFATKLWNATRFAMMNGANTNGELPAFDSLSGIDKWILTRLDETINSVNLFFESYDFGKGCELIYHFAWDDLCDWYLELSKSTFAAGGDPASSTQRVLGYVLDQLLRLMHPVMPFITEELWCNLTGEETLVTAVWPTANSRMRAETSIASISAVQDLVTEIRRFRNDQGIKTSARIGARLSGLAAANLAEYEAAIRFITRIDPIDGGFSAKIEVGKVIVDFDLSGAIDVVAERARLTKDLATAKKDLQTAKVKLENDGFMAKAPMEVVQAIRLRNSQTLVEIDRLSAALAAFADLSE